MKIFRNVTLSLLFLLMGIIFFNTKVYAAKNTDPSFGPRRGEIYFGQEVEIKDGAHYYESADLCGSGKDAKTPNIYTDSRSKIINGYAILDERNSLIQWKYSKRENIAFGEKLPLINRRYLWIHVCLQSGGTTGDIGWFRAADLTFINNRPKSGHDVTKPYPAPGPNNDAGHARTLRPEEAEAIASIADDIAHSGNSTAVLLDVSTSVECYSEQIAAYGKKIANADIYVFGKNFAKVDSTATAGYANAKNNIDNTATDFFTPLNNLSGYENIYLVTDGIQNVEITPQADRISGKLTVVLVSPWLEYGWRDMWNTSPDEYTKIQQTASVMMKNYRTEYEIINLKN